MERTSTLQENGLIVNSVFEAQFYISSFAALHFITQW